MGTSENDGVYVRFFGEQPLHLLFHEIVGSGACRFAVFDERHPHGAGMGHGGEIGIQFGYLHLIASALHSARSAEDAYLAGVGELADGFHGGTYHSQHPPCGIYFG